MTKYPWLAILSLTGLVAVATPSFSQTGPYIGYVYPAGGQQGSTFQVKIGGQRLDGVHHAVVTGEGVTAKIVKYFRPLGAQENSLMREQLNLLRRRTKAAKKPSQTDLDIMANIQERMTHYCPRPACASISALVWLEVTVAPDAEPGERELRLVAGRGATNPMVFHIGQVPEVAREPMITSDMQVLGKEYLAQRKRPEEEVEVAVTLPCTMNGQIASGEVNWYRFSAQKGQRLVISAAARQLLPYIADAVPGWFQPVLAVYDAEGNELEYNDDFRFKPDPTLLFEVPADGEYRVSITDAIFRGREDFVYRLTVAELPFVTSVFPLGGPVGVPASVTIDGWNLDGAKLQLPASNTAPGVHWITAVKKGKVSNAVPFALDTLPECLELESNNDISEAQQVQLPTIVNGRVDIQDDWDVFQFDGKAGQTVVAEVMARRLDSPLDSLLKICDAEGNILAFNDDHEDVASGLNTHHADSYLMLELPADGSYFVQIGDTARSGGPEYAYRLRISEPRPDFELRVVPSAAAFRSKAAAAANVYALRKDGFAGDIKLRLREVDGFTSSTVTLRGDKDFVRLGMRTSLERTDQPVRLTVEGQATIGEQDVVREAVAAEDRMQAFLWRHLVPAQDFVAVIYDPTYQAPETRPVPPPREKTGDEEKPTTLRFTKRQVENRLRQLKYLHQEWLLTDDFYLDKVEECEATL